MRSVVIVLALFAVASCASLPGQSMSPEEWYQQGVSFLKSRQYDEAIGAFSEAIELNPQYAEAYRNRGLAWAKKGEFNQAISDYTKAVEMNPRDGQAYYNRGVAWTEKGDLEQAIADYNKAVEINPRDGQAHYNRGIAWSEKGEFKRGLTDAKKALSLEPENKIFVGLVTALQAKIASQGEDRFQQGLSFLEFGQYDEAIRAFSEAIELSPQYSEAYRNRGLAWAKKGEFDQAISDFTKAVEINPGDGQAYYNRGTVWAEKGALKWGLTDAEKALSLEPNNKTFQKLVTAVQGMIVAKKRNRFRQGASFLESGKYNEAIKAFSDAIELSPQYAEAYRNRGLAWAGKGELDRAISDYSTALKMN
ncbi:MAG: tetratricopeptide repeat protein, partial [Deltaproteobacteria bacterium]|nr:tetratricopeptide repeat protein [Deltaproteobacteria bacterium]